jgi:hypothetical protein
MFFFATLAASHTFMAIDLGSQFIKVAKTTADDRVTILTDPFTNSVIRPAAIALKSPHSLSLPLTDRDFSDLEIRSGAPALPVLKRNSSLGFRYLPRALGRSRSGKFYTSEVANLTELLAQLFDDVVRPHLPIHGLAVILPCYSALEQFLVVSDACYLYQLPVLPMVTDSVALFNLYAATKTNRFAAAPKHVLFVDVGAMSAKVYSGLFTYDGSNPNEYIVTVNQSSLEWTEKVGGYHFASLLAEEKGISFDKAQKLLIRSPDNAFGELFEDVLDILEETVRAAVESVGKIDEVQVVGGSSNFKFVIETIKRATNMSIHRDFNANEAVALGGLITALGHVDRSPYIRTKVFTLPPISLNISCGNRTHYYLRKPDIVNDVVSFRDLPEMCSEYQVVADPATVPYRTEPLYRAYRPKSNLSFSGSGGFTVSFYFAPPHPELQGVEWCQAVECQKSEVIPAVDRFPLVEPAYQFINKFHKSRLAKTLRMEAQETLEKINAALARFSRGNVESTFDPSDEVKAWLREINEQNTADGLLSLNFTEVREVKTKLERIARSVRAQ